MPPSRSKAKRKSLTLDIKMHVIERIEAGERQADVGRSLDLAGSTIRTIIKNADRIKRIFKSTTLTDSKKITRSESSLIEKMEQMLSSWVQGQIQKGVSVNKNVIVNKALNLFNKLKDEDSPEKFVASREWYDRFLQRWDVDLPDDTNCSESQVPETLEVLVDIVCELHFAPCDVLKEISMLNKDTGKIVTAPLKFPRLKEGVIPSLKLNCSSRPSSQIVYREIPEPRMENNHHPVDGESYDTSGQLTNSSQVLKNEDNEEIDMDNSSNMYTFVPGTHFQSSDQSGMEAATYIPETSFETPEHVIKIENVPRLKKRHCQSSEQRQLDNSEQRICSAIEELREISASARSMEREDEFDIFGRSVSAQLRQLPLMDALSVQLKLQTVLTEARIRISQNQSRRENGIIE